MSLVKTDGMKYEAAGTETATDGRAIMRKAYKKAVVNQSTAYTLWLLAVKHKVFILGLGNIILVLNWALPEWPAMVLGLIGK